MVRIIFGAFLLLLGLGLFAEQFPAFRMLGINSSSVLSLFWVVLGIYMITKRHNFWGSIFLIFGIFNLFSGIFGVSSWALLFPVIIIALGVSVLFKKENTFGYHGYHRHHGQDSTTIDSQDFTTSSSQDYLNESVVFNSYDKKLVSEDFSGGKVDVVFGGMELDLRELKLNKNGATIELNAVFGGVNVYVSRDMRVSSSGTGVFGGWTNNYDSSKKEGPTLTIKGAAVFGGVEIKN